MRVDMGTTQVELFDGNFTTIKHVYYTPNIAKT